MNLTHREEVNLYEAIQKSFPKILIKDLTEHEMICPVCNGLGMRIENNIYGIKGDNSEAGRREHFPYKHQALSFCRSCFNGVQRLCPYCGQPYKNQSYMHCDCEGQKEADEEEKIKKWNEKVSKAVPVDEKDVAQFFTVRNLMSITILLMISLTIILGVIQMKNLMMTADLRDYGCAAWKRFILMLMM